MVRRISLLNFFTSVLWGCGPKPSPLHLQSIQRAEVVSYYQSAEGESGQELRNRLHRIITEAEVVDYEQLLEILPNIVEAPDVPGHMRLLYSRQLVSMASQEVSWNLEHVWPQSHGARGAAKSDLHHLQPCENRVNSLRGNKDFLNLNGRGEEIEGAPGNYIDGHRNAIEPRDDIKGDIARMMFYMSVRYDGDKGGVANLELVNQEKSRSPQMGYLADLILWNQADPVDAAEIERNNRIHQLQKNRNPFIDHPEWVDEIWGSN